jgi:hypothetical protein
MWEFKLLLLIVFLLIFYQDCKDRKVYWFLYPLIAIFAFVLQIEEVQFETALFNTVFNLIFVFILLMISLIYAQFKFKRPFLDVFGIGDVLFFICITFSFSILSFFLLFILSLLHSLLLHFAFNNKQSFETVPLAGYMALFFGTVYGLSSFMNCYFLYAY